MSRYNSNHDDGSRGGAKWVDWRPCYNNQQPRQHFQPHPQQHYRDDNRHNSYDNRPQFDDRDRGGRGGSRVAAESYRDNPREHRGGGRGGGIGGGHKELSRESDNHSDQNSRLRRWQDHESETERRLRRSFIERNSDKLEGDHLQSMASAYVNVEMMGNRYPEPVMDRLSELSSGLNEDYKERKKTRLTQQFVAATDAKKRKMMGEAVRGGGSSNGSARRGGDVSNGGESGGGDVNSGGDDGCGDEWKGRGVSVSSWADDVERSRGFVDELSGGLNGDVVWGENRGGEGSTWGDTPGDWGKGDNRIGGKWADDSVREIEEKLGMTNLGNGEVGGDSNGCGSLKRDRVEGVGLGCNGISNGNGSADRAAAERVGGAGYDHARNDGRDHRGGNWRECHSRVGRVFGGRGGGGHENRNDLDDGGGRMRGHRGLRRGGRGEARGRGSVFDGGGGGGGSAGGGGYYRGDEGIGGAGLGFGGGVSFVGGGTTAGSLPTGSETLSSSSNKKFISFARSTNDGDQHFSCDNSKNGGNHDHGDGDVDRGSPPTSRLRSCVVSTVTTTTSAMKEESDDVHSRLLHIANEGNEDDDDDYDRPGGLGFGERPGLGSSGNGGGFGLGFVGAGSNGKSSSPYGSFFKTSANNDSLKSENAAPTRGGLGFGGGGGSSIDAKPFLRPSPGNSWRHDVQDESSSELNPEVSSLLVKQFEKGFPPETTSRHDDADQRRQDDDRRGRNDQEQKEELGPPVIGFRQRHSTFIEKKMADLVFIIKNDKAKVLMNPHGQLGNICQKEKLKLDVAFVKTYKQLADNQKHGKWNKSKRPIEFDVHVFEIIIEGVLITEYEDRNKTSAKNNCLRQVVDMFANCVYLKVDKDSRTPRERLYTWESWKKAPEGAYRYDFLTRADPKARFGGGPIGVVGGGTGGGGRGGGGGQGSKPAGPKGDISQLVILENENLDGRPDVSPSMILQQSAAFCNLDLRMDTASLSTSGLKGLSSLLNCKIYIQENYIAEGQAHNMPIAKQVASANALRKLKQLCPTLIKKAITSNNPDVIYSQVATRAVKRTSMTNDNPGLKMMLKMGWGGGGLGAEEEGIQEPVNVEEQIIDRQGFGFRQANGISTDFLTNIRKRLEEFSRSERKERLIFSRGFTNDERKEIHNIARRCGLKSKSAGKQHNRQLMVWHKKGSTLELIQHMIQSGGETDLYRLIPPPWCLRGYDKPPRLEDL